MDFLLSHWHCILPVGLLLIYFLISGISEKSKKTNMSSGINKSGSAKSIETLDKKLAAGEITKSEYLRKKALID